MSTANPPRGPVESSARGQWLLALLIWAAGGAIVGVAVGWIPSDPGSIRAPRWVLAVAGMAFVAAGFAPLASSTPSRTWASQIAGLGTLGALTLIANWVAFGPGTRHFSGSFAIGSIGISHGHASELGGRIAFGIGALMMDAFVLFVVWNWIRGKQPSK